MWAWNGRFLRINLSKSKSSVEKYDGELAKSFLGGRGFATKILWDEVKPNVEPLSPDNKLILSAGPLTGLPIPSSGKIVVASKSPLTGGYGDGNLGSAAAVNLRRAGVDFLIIEGKFDKPCYINIIDDSVEILDAKELWGLGTFEVEKMLKERHGNKAGVVLIGPAGENKVLFATIMSQEGRSGGRTGMGAVMGSKNLKAIVIEGTGEIPVAGVRMLEKFGREAYEEIRNKSDFKLWMRQGTMIVLDLCQENSVLPTHNFKEGVFDGADKIDGEAMERLKETQKGCPFCNMICGNVVRDFQGELSELDYENVAMLGSNLGIDNLKQISVLNRMADDFGVDTISAGNTLGFAIEGSSRGLIDEEIQWGDFGRIRDLLEKIVHRNGLGDLLAQGTRLMSQKLGKGSSNWAMNIKGLEISGYDCHLAPGMALAYGTSPIGAHHKDAWIVLWEMEVGRDKYIPEKVDKLIELQRIRGGIFESLVTCRFPWVELKLDMIWYKKFLEAATGLEFNMQDLFAIADRIYTLIRAYWIREYGAWDRRMDSPPVRWFNEELTLGPLKGAKLDEKGYNMMLDWYYEKRGWSKNGIPKASTLERLDLHFVTEELARASTLK